MNTLEILSISDVHTVDKDFFSPLHRLLVENTDQVCYSFVLHVIRIEPQTETNGP